MAQVRLNNVRYNAAKGAFEARVDVIRHGTVFRYPCQVPGPANMDYEQVSAELAHSALRMSDSSGVRSLH
ncbi:orotidine 5'-phosphate decarboxylase [Flavimaricola marinus]|uniref:Orotidine 5'-phosphate decarboxylase n=1 Tax=Flavimaricola marinus TaxID=1819565 RepID=A0A238LHC1_9RHOB|nr:orotidine 5'-phosphate decarboxylase [Flavimaricola marinus]SMY09028.1 hypothetical protein LOM8899_03189 [Flavimaricola marinus]